MEPNVRGFIVGALLGGFLLYISVSVAAPLVNTILAVASGFFFGFLGEKYLFK